MNDFQPVPGTSLQPSQLEYDEKTAFAKSVDCFAGFVLYDGHRLLVDFLAPIDATKAERDSAFLSALAQQIELDYLLIGTRDADDPAKGIPTPREGA